MFLCKKHHEGLHGHGVGKGSGYESAASYPNERLDESPPGLFRLKRGSQGHYYLPRTLQRVVGGSVLGHTMGFAAVLWNEEALLIDVIESVDIIGRSLRLQGSLLNF